MRTGTTIGSLIRFAKELKEYWFLITIVMSLMGSIFYMSVFQVTPFDTYTEIKHRRDQTNFHNLVGYDLLEKGHYKLAKEEFERAVNLNATDYEGLNGRYLSELFLSLRSPDWDPAVGLSVQKHLNELGIIKQKELQHIVEKYLGDLETRIGENDKAKSHYETAIKLKPRYLDALFEYGWFSYSGFQDPDLENMERCFKKMTEVDSFDYRGFHGFGYTLYMQAINEIDPQQRRELISKAANQSLRASNLVLHQLNVVMDFGEVARSVDPGVSIYFHELGSRILNDPVISKRSENSEVLGVRLLTRKGLVSLDNLPQQQAWIKYQLALDYLALHRLDHLELQHRIERKKGEGLTLHNNLLKEAKELDKNNYVLPIYKDQLEILNRLLPGVEP